jgi:hypothetical protein
MEHQTYVVDPKEDMSCAHLYLHEQKTLSSGRFSLKNSQTQNVAG